MGDCGTVLVVDDDAGLRSHLSGLLGRLGFEVREASSGEAAVAAARLERPLAVLLDVVLPGGIGGYEVCRELRELYGEGLPIILMSGERTEAHDRAVGIQIGADDYVTKPLNPDELLARVRRLLSRSGWLASTNGSNGEVVRGLTPREHEVLALLASGLSQSEIASRLVISSKTVSTHIQHVLSALGVHSRAQAVAYYHQQPKDADLQV